MHVRKNTIEGVERMLADAILNYAKKNGCYRLALHVLNSNPSRDVWKQIGLVDVSKLHGINQMRLHADAINELAI